MLESPSPIRILRGCKKQCGTETNSAQTVVVYRSCTAMTRHQYLEQDGWVTSDTPHYQQPWVISAMQSFHMKQNKWQQDASRRQPPQTPPPHLKDTSPSQQLFTNSDLQTTPTTLSGLHLAHMFSLQSVWSTLHMSLREASLRMCMSSISFNGEKITFENLNLYLLNTHLRL